MCILYILWNEKKKIWKNIIDVVFSKLIMFLIFKGLVSYTGNQINIKTRAFIEKKIELHMMLNILVQIQNTFH